MNRRGYLASLTLTALTVCAIYAVSGWLNLRIDLTGDKRYTISEPSKTVVKNLDDMVFVRIYLDGEMPVQLKKFRTAVADKLDELQRCRGGKNLSYEFRNPLETGDIKEVYANLTRKGLTSLSIIENDAEGGETQRLIFPGALINYKGKELPVNFIHDNQTLSAEENLNLALQNLEYELVNAIQKISRPNKDTVAFVEGHGELDDYSLNGIISSLADYYEVERVNIDGAVGILDGYKAVVVAKPLQRWTEADKFVIDQYIMNGGRTAWFIDAVDVYQDSLSSGELTMGFVCDHNLNDQLFNYGVRVNHNVVQDMQCAQIQVTLATPNAPAGFHLAPWTYFPLLWCPLDNPITKGINLVKAQYPGVIDTVGNNPEIRKTYLLYSSDKAKVNDAPLTISLSQIGERITERVFDRSHLPVAALLEGEFTSPFRNRIVSQYVNAPDFTFRPKSKSTKMIIVSDGDIIRNEVNRAGVSPLPYDLGFDRNTRNLYGNKDFVMNVINYLTDENGLMEIKNRTLQLRLLDKVKVARHHNALVIINTACPVIAVILCGLAFAWYRKRKYGKRL
jgi:ABC-2 type transport system permease protein